MLLQRTLVGLPALMLGGTQLPVTSAPRDLIPSSGGHGNWWGGGRTQRRPGAGKRSKLWACIFPSCLSHCISVELAFYLLWFEYEVTPTQRLIRCKLDSICSKGQRCGLGRWLNHGGTNLVAGLLIYGWIPNWTAIRSQGPAAWSGAVEADLWRAELVPASLLPLCSPSWLPWGGSFVLPCDPTITLSLTSDSRQ